MIPAGTLAARVEGGPRGRSGSSDRRGGGAGRPAGGRSGAPRTGSGGGRTRDGETGREGRGAAGGRPYQSRSDSDSGAAGERPYRPRRPSDSGGTGERASGYGRGRPGMRTARPWGPGSGRTGHGGLRIAGRRGNGRTGPGGLRIQPARSQDGVRASRGPRRASETTRAPGRQIAAPRATTAACGGTGSGDRGRTGAVPAPRRTGLGYGGGAAARPRRRGLQRPDRGATGTARATAGRTAARPGQRGLQPAGPAA